MSIELPRTSALLLQLPAWELMLLWAELVECYHGVNGYGGDTAEIYAYRLYRFDPVLNLAEKTGIKMSDWEDRTTLRSANAVDALEELIRSFCAVYKADVTVDGVSLDRWSVANKLRFDHRAHVRIIR